MLLRYCVPALFHLTLVALVPLAAEDDVKSKIARLEKQLRETKKFDFSLHNELRHLYSTIDEEKALIHCDAIFRFDPTNVYTLDCIGARDADRSKAATELIRVAEKYPELTALSASCWLKSAELTADLAKRRVFLQKVAGAKGDGLDRHHAIAAARIAAINRPQTTAPWTIRVLVINYFPLTADKTKIDIAVTSNVGAPVKVIEAKCARQTKEVIEALEEGSRFRSYSNVKAKPSLQYQVVDTITFYEPVPHHSRKKNFADYYKILERVKIKDWVEKIGVREVWIWGYHSKEIAPVESNMASVHGDVSNSHRDPLDLSVLKHTYTVYHYNYERGTDMAVHNHLHQIEAVMRHHGGELWRIFEGKPGDWRCGNCHFPVNGVKDYDYANKTHVESDIEDWKPEGFGKKQRINCDRWNGSDLNWYVYWMQAIPGADNGLTYKSRNISNWWEFIGNYDQAAMRKSKLTD